MSHEINTEFNPNTLSRLRLLKKLYGYSFSEIANGCGYSKSVIVRTFNGKYNPNKNLKQKIADFFKINSLELWKKENE